MKVGCKRRKYLNLQLEENKMKLTKKLAKVVFVLVVAVTCVSSVNVFASDKDYDFEFQIGRWGANACELECRERTTKNPNNAWKVRLDESGEGDGTISRFWLEINSGKNVSDAVNAKQGAAALYKEAKDSASGVWVYLTGENNNFNSNTYLISGIWDEETGVIID